METLNKLWPYELTAGLSSDPSMGACAMQAINWLVHQKTGDMPECVSPVLVGFVVSLNDRLDLDTRQRLLPYLPRLAGTNVDWRETRLRLEAGFTHVCRNALRRVLRPQLQSDFKAENVSDTIARVLQDSDHYRVTDKPYSRAVAMAKIEVLLLMLGFFPSTAERLLQKLIADLSAEEPDIGRRAGDALFDFALTISERVSEIEGTPYEDILFDVLDAMLRAGPQGEPWSADRVDAAVASFQAAGGPPVPTTT